MLEKHGSAAKVHWAGPESAQRRLLASREFAQEIKASEPASKFPDKYCLHREIKYPVIVLDDLDKLIVQNKPGASLELLGVTLNQVSNFGGLVIITSNNPDPLALLDDAPASFEEQRMLLSIETFNATQLPENRIDASHLDTSAQRERNATAVRSRFANIVKMINFTGEDLRPNASFWNSN